METSELIQQLLLEEETAKKTQEPGIGSRILGGVEDFLGYQSKQVQDYIRNEVSGATGWKMPETATAGGMLRSGLGLSQGDEGFGGAILGKAVESGMNMITDPLTYEAFALPAGRIGQAATAGFTALGTIGAVEAAGRGYERYKQEGFTPKVAEDVFDTVLQGSMAAAGAHHLVEGPLVASRIPHETLEVLLKRREGYKKSGKTELLEMVEDEIANRRISDDQVTAQGEGQDRQHATDREAIINQARQQYPNLGLDRIAGLVDQALTNKISIGRMHGLLARTIRENVNSAQPPGSMTPEQEALAAKQKELLQGQPNPFATEAPPSSTQEAAAEEMRRRLSGEQVPADEDAQGYVPGNRMDRLERANQAMQMPDPGAVAEQVRAAQTPEEVAAALDRLEAQKPTEAPLVNQPNPAEPGEVGDPRALQGPVAALPGGDPAGVVAPEGPIAPGPGLPGGVAVPDTGAGPGELAPVAEPRVLLNGRPITSFSDAELLAERHTAFQRDQTTVGATEVLDLVNKELMRRLKAGTFKPAPEAGAGPGVTPEAAPPLPKPKGQVIDITAKPPEGEKLSGSDRTWISNTSTSALESTLRTVEEAPNSQSTQLKLTAAETRRELLKREEEGYDVIKGKRVPVEKKGGPDTVESSSIPTPESAVRLQQLLRERLKARAKLEQELRNSNLSQLEKNNRLHEFDKRSPEELELRSTKVAQEHIAETTQKTGKPATAEDLLRMESDERVVNTKNVLDEMINEAKEGYLSQNRGGLPPGGKLLNSQVENKSRVTDTRVTNLSHNPKELGANVNRGSVRVNIPITIREVLKRIKSENAVRASRGYAPHSLLSEAKMYASELRNLGRHELVHSILGTSHTGDIFWGHEEGYWQESLTGQGRHGPYRQVPFEVEDPGLWEQLNGEKRTDFRQKIPKDMQNHTLEELELYRQLQRQDTPYSDALMLTDAAEPELLKLWEDAKSVDKELQDLVPPEKSRTEKVIDKVLGRSTPTEASTVPPAATTQSKVLDPAMRIKLTDAFAKALKSKHLTSAQATDLMAIADQHPTKAASILGIAQEPTSMEKVREGWKLNLISGPSTWVVKAATDTTEIPMRLGESALAPLVDRLLPGPRTRFSGEAKAELKGVLSRVTQAGAKLSQDLVDAFTLAPEKINPDRPLELQFGKIGGTLGRAWRTPGRAINGITDFYQTTGAAGELGKLAFRKANLELKGKTPAQIEARAEQILQEAMNPLNQDHVDLLKKANATSHERVFQNDDPGPLLGALTTLRSKNPWIHAFMPFLQVPGNITRMIVQRSPFGVFKAAKAYRAFSEAVKTGKGPAEIAKLKGEAVDAITRPLLGTAIMGTMYAYAKTGGMTDSGPTDPRKKNLLLQSGWQPYSFKVGKTYIPYHRFEPIGSLLGMAADAANLGNAKGADEAFDKVLHSLTENFTNQSYMQSIADAMKFISDPKTAVKTYSTSMAGSVIPNIIRRGAQALDPVIRDIKPRGSQISDIPDLMRRSVQAGIPGLSQLLPAKLSDTGEPIKRAGFAVSRFASPVQPSWENEDTPTMKHLLEIDYAPGLPTRSIKIQGQDIELSQEEYETIAKANRKAIEYVKTNYFTNSRFMGLPPERQKKYVEKIFSATRSAAKARVVSSEDFRGRARKVLNAS